jgi:hypothetical protein
MAEQVLPGSEEAGGGRRRMEWRVLGRNGPNNACTYE